METGSPSGRRLVVAVIAATLTTSVIVIATFNMDQGSDRLPLQIVRFLLTLGLCFLLYRGTNWARWVAGILFGLTGLGSLAGGFALLSAHKPGLAMIALGFVYSASAIVLFFVPSVRNHFRGAGAAPV